MRLWLIGEAGTPIRTAADALGSLITFTYGLGECPEREALNTFLKQPSPRQWEDTLWIIDSLIRRASELPNTQRRMKDWAKLKSLTSPTIAAAIHDINQRQTKGTPLQTGALSKLTRDRFKFAVGPQGYVSSLAYAGQIPMSKLKMMMKDIARSGPALVKAAKADLPDVRPRTKF